MAAHPMLYNVQYGDLQLSIFLFDKLEAMLARSLFSPDELECCRDFCPLSLKMVGIAEKNAVNFDERMCFA
jgi:hypothetical protein